MESVARINFGAAPLIPRDIWRFYKNVLGSALESAPAVLPVLTNAAMALLTDMIEMGPFNALEILPLITTAGTTATLEVVGWAGAVNTGLTGAPNLVDAWAQGREATHWLGENLARLSLATPSADVGDLTPIFGTNVVNTDKAFTANTLTGTPTQIPAAGAIKGNVTPRLSTAGVIRIRTENNHKVQVLVTGTSAVGDHCRLIVRRVRVESDA